MPKYFYSCKECEYTFAAYHSPKERLKNCSQCDTIDGLVRQVNKVFILKNNELETKKIGELTKEFIEDNKKVLKEIKEDLKNYEHNDTNNLD